MKSVAAVAIAAENLAARVSESWRCRTSRLGAKKAPELGPCDRRRELANVVQLLQLGLRRKRLAMMIACAGLQNEQHDALSLVI
ncbi:hypothetical protein [Xanthobacter sp. ZOL 2024]